MSLKVRSTILGQKKNLEDVLARMARGWTTRSVRIGMGLLAQLHQAFTETMVAGMGLAEVTGLGLAEVTGMGQA